jgi:hypothetical protein
VRLRKAEIIETKKEKEFDKCEGGKKIAILKNIPVGVKPLLRILRVYSSNDKDRLDGSIPQVMDDKVEITFGKTNHICYLVQIKGQQVILSYEGVKLNNIDEWDDLRQVVKNNKPYKNLAISYVNKHKKKLQNDRDKQLGPGGQVSNSKEIDRKISEADEMENCFDAIQCRANLSLNVYIIVNGLEVVLATTDPKFDYDDKQAWEENK